MPHHFETEARNINQIHLLCGKCPFFTETAINLQQSNDCRHEIHLALAHSEKQPWVQLQVLLFKMLSGGELLLGKVRYLSCCPRWRQAVRIYDETLPQRSSMKVPLRLPNVRCVFFS